MKLYLYVFEEYYLYDPVIDMEAMLQEYRDRIGELPQ